MSCDVQDAFLTVKQRDPTMIVVKDAVGNEQPYALGRVLPGQRAGSQLWNEDITNHLKQTLDMIECEIYPSMLKTKDNKLFILLHVDDLLVTGHAAICHQPMIEHYLNEKNKKKKYVAQFFLGVKPKKFQWIFVLLKS